MKTRIRKPKYQEKVVFSVEIENENLESNYYPESEEYVEAFIGSMLKKRNLTTDAAGGHNQAPWRVRGRLPQGIPGGETSGNEQIKWGTRKNTNLHEKGKGDLTTEDTECTEC